MLSTAVYVMHSTSQRSTSPILRICDHAFIMAMWKDERALRRGQVPFVVHIKVGPGSLVAMENGRAVSTGSMLTSGNYMQKAAMFVPIPQSILR